MRLGFISRVHCTRAPLPSVTGPFENCRQIGVERRGDLHKVEEGNVGLAALDAPHVGTLYIRQVSQFLLRHIAISPGLPDGFAQRYEQMILASISGSA